MLTNPGCGTGNLIGDLPGVTDLLEIEDLHTQIGHRRSIVRAVDGVSFTIRPGETVGLVGESGCGKTMTALSVVRLLPPGGRITGGSVRLNGRDLTALEDEQIRHVRGNEIGVIFQDPMTSLNPTMAIGDQIAEGVRTHRGATKASARERALDVLDLVGMPQPRQRMGDFPHQLPVKVNGIELWSR